MIKSAVERHEIDSLWYTRESAKRLNPDFARQFAEIHKFAADGETGKFEYMMEKGTPLSDFICAKLKKKDGYKDFDNFSNESDSLYKWLVFEIGAILATLNHLKVMHFDTTIANFLVFESETGMKQYTIDGVTYANPGLGGKNPRIALMDFEYAYVPQLGGKQLDDTYIRDKGHYGLIGDNNDNVILFSSVYDPLFAFLNIFGCLYGQQLKALDGFDSHGKFRFKKGRRSPIALLNKGDITENRIRAGIKAKCKEVFTVAQVDVIASVYLNPIWGNDRRPCLFDLGDHGYVPTLYLYSFFGGFSAKDLMKIAASPDGECDPRCGVRLNYTTSLYCNLGYDPLINRDGNFIAEVMELCAFADEEKLKMIGLSFISAVKMVIAMKLEKAKSAFEASGARYKELCDELLRELKGVEIPPEYYMVGALRDFYLDESYPLNALPDEVQEECIEEAVGLLQKGKSDDRETDITKLRELKLSKIDQNATKKNITVYFFINGEAKDRKVYDMDAFMRLTGLVSEWKKNNMTNKVDAYDFEPINYDQAERIFEITESCQDKSVYTIKLTQCNKKFKEALSVKKNKEPVFDDSEDEESSIRRMGAEIPVEYYMFNDQEQAADCAENFFDSGVVECGKLARFESGSIRDAVQSKSGNDHENVDTVYTIEDPGNPDVSNVVNFKFALPLHGAGYFYYLTDEKPQVRVSNGGESDASNLALPWEASNLSSSSDLEDAENESIPRIPPMTEVVRGEGEVGEEDPKDEGLHEQANRGTTEIKEEILTQKEEEEKKDLSVQLSDEFVVIAYKAGRTEQEMTSFIEEFKRNFENQEKIKPLKARFDRAEDLGSRLYFAENPDPSSPDNTVVTLQIVNEAKISFIDSLVKLGVVKRQVRLNETLTLEEKRYVEGLENDIGETELKEALKNDPAQSPVIDASRTAGSPGAVAAFRKIVDKMNQFLGTGPREELAAVKKELFGENTEVHDKWFTNKGTLRVQNMPKKFGYIVRAMHKGGSLTV